MTKRILTIAGIVAGVLVVALAYGLVVRGIWVERSQQTALADQLEIVETTLANQQADAGALPTRQAELAMVQAEQATVQAELVSARLAFPSEVDSTEVLAQVVSAAAIHGVTLRQIEAKEPTTTTVEALTYRLYEYQVTVEGELETVLDFLAALESGPVNTLSLDGVDVGLATTTPPGSGADGAPPPPDGDAPLYEASLAVQVHVRLARPGTTPLPPLGTPLPPEARARQLEDLLEQAYAEKDWERAISLLLVLRQMRPDDPALEDQLVDAYVREGQRRLAAGQLDDAESNFRAALALQPDHAAAREGLAVLGLLTPTPGPTLRPTLPSTPTLTPTPTPRPTKKPKPKPSRTPTPTPTPEPEPFYVSDLRFASNTRYPALGCKWFGFVGRIANAQGYPLQGLTVRVWAASWPGVEATTDLNGEYEIYLDDHPRAETWLVQLYQGGQAVSEVIEVESLADCSAVVIEMDWRRRE